MYIRAYIRTVEPYILDTLGPEGTVLTTKVSSYQRLKLVYSKAWKSFGSNGMFHIREVSAIQGSGLEGCLQFSGLD